MDKGSGIMEVHRPESLEEAVRLLSRPDVPTVPLFVSPRPTEMPPPGASAAVDPSRLGLDVVRLTGRGLGLGSAATLEAILKSPIGRTPAGALIQEACRTTAHSVLRAVASVGGVVGCGEPSDLLLALLALDAMCIAQGTVPREVPLAGFSSDFGELLLEVRIPLPRGDSGVALERVARTPRDRSIVAVAAMLELDGAVCIRARLALSGVAPRATRWRTAEALMEGKSLISEGIARAAATVEMEAHPQSDHLGCTEYRRTVGVVLARRAVTAAWERARSSQAS